MVFRTIWVIVSETVTKLVEVRTVGTLIVTAGDWDILVTVVVVANGVDCVACKETTYVLAMTIATIDAKAGRVTDDPLRIGRRLPHINL